MEKIYACDFETTVYEGQDKTEVWSSAICPVRTKAEITGKRPKKRACADDVIVHHSIDETYKWLQDNAADCVLYYHNLKFDGSFWLDYLMRRGWQYVKREHKKDEFPAETFETCISDMGQWYYIRLNFAGYKVELRDSLKLLPMDLRSLAKSFKTEHQKLEMEYTGRRYPGCPIYAAEMNYIKNDVLVLMECLEEVFSEGHNKLTIGSCCLNEYRHMINRTAWKENFPALDKIQTPDYIAESNADEYIRKSYKGGWCYAMPNKCGHIIKGGCTADVNSLYPSMMHSESGNRYPVGVPHYWRGSIPRVAKRPDRWYVVRIRCAFAIKPNHLPFIQIKGNLCYKGTEMLTDSRPTIHGVKYQKFHDAVFDKDITDVVELTLTCTDYKLFKEQYYVYEEEILSGCWFYTDIGIFDEYINKYRDIKIHSKGAKRQIAKLFLNNLYGKMAASTNSSYKIPVFDSDGNIKMQLHLEHTKKPGYIAVGTAITSYARNFTIRAAQANYKYFCYADTDSIHCSCSPDQLKNVPVDPVAFCHWKIESCWDQGFFVRQKTYIEHVNAEDEKPVDSPYYNVKCAGLPDNCKDVYIQALEETKEEEQHARQMQKVCELIKDNPLNCMRRSDYEKYKFLAHKKTVYDFKAGFTIWGKLTPVRIRGGILLMEGPFTMRE